MHHHNGKDKNVFEESFEIVDEEKPIVLTRARVNGKGPYTFALDISSSLTIVSVDLAEDMNLEVTGRKEGLSAGMKVSILLSKVDSVEVGGAEVRNLQVGIMDLLGLTMVLQKPIDGVLGYNFLKMFRVTLDYPNRKLILER